MVPATSTTSSPPGAVGRTSSRSPPRSFTKSRNRKTPTNKSFRKTPVFSGKFSKQRMNQGDLNFESVNNGDNNGFPLSDEEESFEDHSKLCERMAKTFYFANKLPSTPRPSLPLTMLAVNTFSTARKDTLEFLDLEMAAEIGRNACVSPTALIMALVYLERLSSHNPGYLNCIKPSELFVVSLLVASKFIQDDGEDLGIFNDEWATSAQMELKKLNGLELQFLTAIDWRVNVEKEEYNMVMERLERKLAVDQGIRRGWFTYTEIGKLGGIWDLIWPTLYEHCFKVITAACMTYATLIATVLTSSFLAPHIFYASKNFMTANIQHSVSSGFTSDSCNNSGYANTSSCTLPVGSEGFGHNDETMFITDDSILNEENKTYISISDNLQDRPIYQHFRSFNYETSDMTWKNRMRVKGRMKFGVLNCKETVNENDHCRPPTRYDLPEALNEVFGQYLQNFLNMNGQGSKIFCNSEFSRNQNDFNRDISATKCSQYLTKPVFPFGSVIKV